MNAIKWLAWLVVFSTAEASSKETQLMLDNGEYKIPAIYSVPDGEGEYPAVILLHGTASNKNEVGNLYARLAQKLRMNNIASIRIDFAGTGDSPVDYSRYTLASATSDASIALTYLTQQTQVKANSIAVLGFSQGGLIAQLIAIKHPNIAALVTWSSVAGDGKEAFGAIFDRHYNEALSDGVVELTFAWRPPLNLSLQWFQQIAQQTSLTDLAGYLGPSLAIAGGADEVVEPISSFRLIQATGSQDGQSVILKGANHIFNVLNPTAEEDETLLKITLQWLTEKLH